jgi:hypothetical protein
MIKILMISLFLSGTSFLFSQSVISNTVQITNSITTTNRIISTNIVSITNDQDKLLYTLDSSKIIESNGMVYIRPSQILTALRP